MKNKIWMLLVIVAVCAVPAFGAAGPQRDEEATSSLRCLDCDPYGGGGWSGDTTYQEGQYLDNPCTSIQDWVWVNYSTYASGLQTAAGVDRYQLSENTSMSGTYATSGSGSADVAYAQMFSQRMYHKVNTPDNFHVVTVITFNPATKVMTLSLETACGNGMPDSIE
jgi:hypothetical protein